MSRPKIILCMPCSMKAHSYFVQWARSFQGMAFLYPSLQENEYLVACCRHHIVCTIYSVRTYTLRKDCWRLKVIAMGRALSHTNRANFVVTASQV